MPVYLGTHADKEIAYPCAATVHNYFDWGATTLRFNKAFAS
jgi:hypothetical protein